MAGFDNEVMFALGERLQASTAQAIQLMQQTATDVSNVNFTGDPNGSVSANPSSLSHDPVSGDLWLKATGTGNTGWVLLSAGGSVTLEADDGNSLTGSSFNLFGQKAGTVPVMDTLVAGGDFLFENRAWESQYVVDNSTTAGLQGTFSTIQSALDQAVTDGMAFNNFKKITIRPGTYTENLVIPPGAILEGSAHLAFPSGGPITPLNSVNIVGNHTFTGNAICGFNGLNFTNSSGDIFADGAAGIALLYFDNCFLAPLGGDHIINFTLANSYFSFFASSFAGVGDSTAFSSTGGGSKIYMKSCKSEQNLNMTIDGSDFTCLDTNGLGVITLTTGSSITAIASSFVSNASPNYLIDPSVSGNSCTLIGCSFNGGAIAAIGPASGGNAHTISNCTCNTGAKPYLYGNTVNVNAYCNETQGNLIKSYRTAVNYNVDANNYYIGVTDTSAPRTINLSDGAGVALPERDQVFIVKDESGGAATNNITVTTQGGTVLIDGQVSQVINSNYGCISVIYDGTNYFII